LERKVLGDFFTSSSGHPDSELRNPIAFYKSLDAASQRTLSTKQLPHLGTQIRVRFFFVPNIEA
jgi:hypothetical protein